MTYHLGQHNFTAKTELMIAEILENTLEVKWHNDEWIELTKSSLVDALAEAYARGAGDMSRKIQSVINT